MLKDFSKIETFLVVARERGFSKASTKLGISQPAVTQQIRHLENMLDTKLIDRKKNGIKLTSTGEELYKIALELEHAIIDAENKMLKIIKKDITFNLGASFTIGNYILPGECLHSISRYINNDVKLTIEVSKKIVDGVKDRSLDLGLIEAPIFDEDLSYRKWLEDELVLFSNVPLPREINIEDLYKYKWVCREVGSHTRDIISDKFQEAGIKCTEFEIISEVNSSTALINSVARAKKDLEKPIISIISKYTIMHDVVNKKLYQSKIKGIDLNRYLYVVSHKNNKQNPFVKGVVDYILSGKC